MNALALSANKNLSREAMVMAAFLPIAALLMGLPSMGIYNFMVNHGLTRDGMTFTLFLDVVFAVVLIAHAVIVLGFNNGLRVNQWFQWRLTAKISSVLVGCAVYGWFLQGVKFFEAWYETLITTPSQALTSEAVLTPICFITIFVVLPLFFGLATRSKK